MKGLKQVLGGLAAAAMAVCAAAAVAQAGGGPPATAGAQAGGRPPAAAAIPELPFKLVEGFFHYPAHYGLSPFVGIAIGPKGQTVTLNRGAHPVMEFKPDGTFSGSWGEGSKLFEGGHVVRFDPQGNLWYVDAGDNVIYRFDNEGRTVGILGTNDEPWTFLTHVFQGAVRRKSGFYQPTDIGWSRDGRIFVADGYGNSRIVAFDRNGNYIKEWGERGNQPGNFNTPHSLVIDKDDVIYVADRANNRIQTFDTEGNLKQVWALPFSPWSLCLTNGPQQAMFVGSVGKIYKLDIATGKVLGQFGHMGRFPGSIDAIHQIACPNENTLFFVNEMASRIDKWVLP